MPSIMCRDHNVLATGWGSGFPPPVQHAGVKKRRVRSAVALAWLHSSPLHKKPSHCTFASSREFLFWCPPMCWHHRGSRTRTAGAFGVAPHRLHASMGKQLAITSAPRNDTEHYTWVDPLLKLWVCQSLHTSLPPGSFWSHLTKIYVRHLGLGFRF